MITASEAVEKTLFTLKAKDAEREHRFKGFIEYADKKILDAAICGNKSVRLLFRDFKSILWKEEIPLSLVTKFTANGFSVSRSYDLEDGHGITIKWMD